jgi:hypothetical protein
LCVDAIIDAGDSNSDWRLDFDEYKALMDSSFQPKEKCIYLIVALLTKDDKLIGFCYSMFT